MLSRFPSTLAKASHGATPGKGLPSPILPSPLSPLPSFHLSNRPPRNRHQNHLPPSKPHTLVLYGHNAKAGLRVNPEVGISPYDPSCSSTSSGSEKHKHRKKPKETGLRYAFGLDSGCGHDRELTALVIEAGPAGINHRIEQVKCGG